MAASKTKRDLEKRLAAINVELIAAEAHVKVYSKIKNMQPMVDSWLDTISNLTIERDALASQISVLGKAAMVRSIESATSKTTRAVGSLQVKSSMVVDMHRAQTAASTAKSQMAALFSPNELERQRAELLASIRMLREEAVRCIAQQKTKQTT
jgi:hypothetical protein